MKKIMMIAVLVSAMLMPAQLMAQKNRENQRQDNRPRIESRNTCREGNRKEMRVEKRDNRQHAVNSHKPAHHKPQAHHKQHVVHHKPQVVHHHTPVHVTHSCPPPVVVHHPAPRPVVVHHPAPRVHYHCDGDVASAAAVAIGVVGLISLLAN